MDVHGMELDLITSVQEGANVGKILRDQFVLKLYVETSK